MALNRVAIPRQARSLLDAAQCWGSEGPCSLHLVLSDQYFGWSDPRWCAFGSPGEAEVFTAVTLEDICEVKYLCTPFAARQWLRVSWALEQGLGESADFKVRNIHHWHRHFRDKGVPIVNAEEVSSWTWRGFLNTRFGGIWVGFWYLGLIGLVLQMEGGFLDTALFCLTALIATVPFLVGEIRDFGKRSN